MQNTVCVWVFGGLALIAGTANEVLNGIVAFGCVAESNLLLALRIVLFLAFGLSLIGIISITYFTALFLPHVMSKRLKRLAWILYGAEVAVVVSTIGLSGLALVWARIQRRHLPEQILLRDPNLWIYIWFGVWGASVILHGVFLSVLGTRTRRLIRDANSFKFGRRNQPAMRVITDRGRCLDSRDTTLAPTPRSPSTKTLTTATSRTKLIGKHSARSSLEHPVPPVGEVLTMDAFEQWDTSSVHYEMRSAVGPSPVAKSTVPLEPIPGSRPGSASPLDRPFEPMSTPARVTSPTSTTYEFSSPVSHHHTSHKLPSTPPSSPPNFSRPTSTSKIRAFQASAETAEEHVHPLFRSTSPLPPPVATLNTKITVANSDEPITPKSLARVRKSIQDRGLRQSVTSISKGHWRAMPSVDAPSTRPSTAGSNGPGSPGPSIVDEEELPPILPGFVLGAGTRTSFLGYNSRKLTKKEKRSSRLSNIE